MRKPKVATILDAAHRQLKHDRTIDVELDTADQLLVSDGRSGSGVDSLLRVLDSALRLPDTLVVRVTLPAASEGNDLDAAVFHDYCHDQATNAWGEAMTLRQGGIRELPRALLISVLVATIGVGVGYLAQESSSTVLIAFLYAVAFIAVVASWTIGWAPIEQALFDWHAPGHTAAAYELLAQASLEVVERDVTPRPGAGASGPERR